MRPRTFTPDAEPVDPRPCPQHGRDKWYACCSHCYEFHMPQNLARAKGRNRPASLDAG